MKKSNKEDVQLSNILNNEHNVSADDNQATEIIEKSVIKDNIRDKSNTSKSSVPSGVTDILNTVGNDWMTFSIEDEYDNNLNNNNNNNCDDQESSDKCDHNDDLTKDPDYSLNNELLKDQDNSLNNELSKERDRDNSLNQNNTNNTHDTSHSRSKEDSSSMEISSFSNVPPLDIRNVRVPYSKNSSSTRTVKKYFSPYCKKLQTKFARHLELKHKTEADVQKFIHIKKGTQERAKIISAIRNHGSLLHNTHHELNTGILLTVR